MGTTLKKEKLLDLIVQSAIDTMEARRHASSSKTNRKKVISLSP